MNIMPARVLFVIVFSQFSKTGFVALRAEAHFVYQPIFVEVSFGAQFQQLLIMRELLSIQSHAFSQCSICRGVQAFRKDKRLARRSER
jgi:hypothetical protein